ncbi:MAG: tetratricopeptide repeat protein, partial [Planctomycetota bacterium]
MTPRPPLPLLGRYRLLRTIAASPERRVYLAEDLYRGAARSVFKVFALEDGALDEARRVFSALRTLRHPGVAEIYDFGRLDPRDVEATDPEAQAPRGEILVYLASAFSKGLDLRDAFLLLFRPDRGERPAEGSAERWKVFLEALARIAQALDAIHSRGIIHYDVKVENLLLEPEPSAAKIERFAVKVLDFGLSERATTPIGTRARGTVPFLAPEIVERSSADFRSDLFSFGVAIAYAVSGRAPFPGSSPREQMEAARSGKRIPLRSLAPEAPEALSEIVDGLLEPDPARRPASAALLARALGEAGGFRLDPGRQFRTAPSPTVGWERELARVRAEIEKAKRGEAEIACILAEGSEDCFLDRFADEASNLAKTEGVRVVGGRSRLPREFAYQPFGEIVSQILQHVDADAPRFARFAPVLELLCPSSRARAEGRRWALPPLESLRAELYRFLDLVAEFFLEAGRQVPLLVCVREVQRAGRESVDLLRSLVRAIGLRGLRRTEGSEETGDPARVLILATARSAEPEGELEPEASAGLAQLAAEPRTLRLPLENLSIEETAGWIRERLPALKVDGDALRRLHEKCAGSAAHLEEFARRVEASTEESPAGIAEASPQVLAHALLALPRKASKAALERFQHLRGEDRRVLEVLSAAGGSLRAEVLEDVAAGEDEDPAGAPSGAPARDAPNASFERRMAELEALGFLEVREGLDGSVVALELPALANEIARQMPEGVRRALHRRLALAARAGPAAEHPARVPEDVAFHALQGGLADLFAEESLRAAESLEAARAFECAARVYEGVLDSLGSRAPEGRAEDAAAPELSGGRRVSRAAITERLAEIYRETGQAQRSLERLTVLASDPEVARDPVRLASAYRRMGEVFSQSGECANAAHFLERALGLLPLGAELPAAGAPASAADSLRAPADSSRALAEHLRCLLALGRLEASRENLARACEILAEAVRRGEPHPRILARAHLLLAEILQKRGLQKEGLRSSLEALDIARRDGGRSLLLETLRAVGSTCSDQGLYDRAAELFEEAIEVAASLESKFDLAACHSSLGTVYHNRADHEAALEHFRRSLALSSEIGDVRGIARSYNNLGLVHRIQDDLGRAAECYRLSIDLFTRVNDPQGIAAGMNNLASILELEGKYDEALEYSFRALEKRRKTRSGAGMAFSYYGIGRIYQARGEIEKAISYAEKSLEIRRELGDKLGGAYSSLLLSDLAISQDRYPEALRLAAGALEEFGRLGNEVGVLLARVARARVLAALGDFEEARRSLEETLARARRSGQTALVGSCLLHLGALAAELGNPEEAGVRLVEAERLLRSKRGRRELVQVLLARASLSVSTGDLAHASSALEEAYSVLEDIGSRDLVPRYFLLRGRLELRSIPPELEAAKNFLERGLVEARESSSRELQAQFHHSLGILETMRGDAKLAAIHFEEAREILEDLARSLPAGLSERFYRVREREEIRSSAAGTRPGWR